MPQSSLPPVGTDSGLSLTSADLDQISPQPSSEGSVLYANQPLPAAASPQTVNLPSVSSPAIADDVDLIEKEWVNKISETIQKTKGDPYERARQLALLKSEYLQKRYQKTIKLT